MTFHRVKEPFPPVTPFYAAVVSVHFTAHLISMAINFVFHSGKHDRSSNHSYSLIFLVTIVRRIDPVIDDATLGSLVIIVLSSSLFI